MRRRCSAAVLLALSLRVIGPAEAQDAQGRPGPMLVRFESWQSPPAAPSSAMSASQSSTSSNRTRQALIGGAIGAAAGLLTCTVVSTASNDSAEGGLSFCPVDSNLLFAGAGFLIGAVIGWLI
jgi:hypothetical protein